ncbi:MAG: MFS transporter [Bacillota bacterium]
MRTRSKLLFICVVSFTQFTAETMMRQIIPLQAESIGAPPGLIGLIVSSYSILPLILAIPSGEIIDRVGFRVMIAASCVAMAISSAILVLAPTVGGLVMAQVVAGVANVIVILSAQAYVAGISSASDRTRNFSIYSLAMAGGFLLGPPLGGMIADLGGYVLAFGAGGILSVAAALLVIPLPPSGNDESRSSTAAFPAPARGARQMLQQSWRLLGRREVQLSLYVSLLGLFGLSMRNSFYPVYLNQVGHTTSRIGLLIALQSAVSFLVRPFMGSILKRGFFLPVSCAMIAGALGIGLTPQFTGFASLAIVSALYGLTTAVSQPVSMILMASGSDLQHQGLAMGLRQTANQGALLAGPLLLGLLTARLGIAHSFFFVAALWGAGAASLLLLRATSRRTQPGS